MVQSLMSKLIKELDEISKVSIGLSFFGSMICSPGQ
jgi:hypothetical protein